MKTSVLRRMAAALFFGVALTASAPSFGRGVPILLEDVEKTPGQRGAQRITPIGEVAYFAGRDATHGEELWRTDGTAAGTWRVTDLWPGRGGSLPDDIVPFADGVMFVAADERHGFELWRMNPTDAAAELVRDILPGPEGSRPYDLTPVGQRVFFRVFPRGGVEELWVTDGTAEGTVRLLTGLGLGRLTALGERLYFSIEGDGFEMWTTDGTVEGTRQVADLSDDSSVSYYFVGPAGRSLFFSVSSTGRLGRPTELWVSDGTSSGASSFFDLGVGFPRGQILGVLDAYLYFTVTDDENQRHIVWRTDGTRDGTEVFLTPPAALRSVHELVKIGEAFYLIGVDREVGGSLWKTDGTTGGTQRLADANPAQCSGDFGRLTVAGERVFFLGRRPGNDVEVWTSDGSIEGTGPTREIVPEGGSNPDELVALGDRVLFVARSEEHGRELWTSDGTETGTEMVLDLIDGSRGSYTSQARPVLGVIDDQFYFSGGRTLGLWRSRGPGANRERVPGSEELLVSFLERGPFATEDRIFFIADDALWSTDGTASGTVELAPGGTPGATLGTDLLFANSSEEFGVELWKTDGTPSGTALLADLHPGRGDARPAGFRRVGDLVFFAARTAAHGEELWRTDGGADGTVVLEVFPGTGSSRPFLLAHGANQLFFVADDGEHGRELWRTDGTPEGTYLLLDLIEGPEGGLDRMSSAAVVSDDRLYFLASEEEGAVLLWTSDGTRAGTEGPFPLEPRGLWQGPPVVLDGDVYFASNGLWRLDGDSLEASLVAADVFPRDLTRVGDRLYFSSGELWRSDGTPSGTRKVTEIRPGPASASLSPLQSIGDRLYFTASDGVRGRELWTLSCGNGRREADEQCDLGRSNGLPGAGCTSWCARTPGANGRDRLGRRLPATGTRDGGRRPVGSGRLPLR